MMKLNRRRTLRVLIVVLFFVSGFFSVRYFHRPRIRLGEHYLFVNYRAKVNPKKNYHLQLWDYRWPGVDGDQWYEPFITELVKEFEKANPNIRVELSLLDFYDGPLEFSKALASGSVPDVYCSAYDIPEFNYRWQIPAGIFLKPEELNEYYPSLRKRLTSENYLLTLPRWSVPLIWVGNRTLLEKAGLSVEGIQKQGWVWGDYTKIKERAEYSCIGNLSANGLLTQIVSQKPSLSPSLILKTLDIFNGPLPWKSDLEANMIHLFLSGKLPLIAGVRPTVYDFLRQKAAASHLGWEPVLLPPPSEQSRRIILPVENGVIGIYRHHKSGGDDQLAAAARLAFFLSVNRQTHPWQRLKVVPATPTTAKQWAQNLEPNDGNRLLVDWLAEADVYSLRRSPDYQGKVYPGLKNYLMGRVSRDELEKIIVQNYFGRK
ncbi:MAG: extracellular solute-binding protein [Firmicutes bacterium]|nr:extracellular solute-binding protein [Bacillota bacterium]